MGRFLVVGLLCLMAAPDGVVGAEDFTRPVAPPAQPATATTRAASTAPASVAPPEAPVRLGLDGLPLRVGVRLRDVLWQPLPASVQQVFVGPDQRTWYVMTRPSAPWAQAPAGQGATLVQIERLIEREFARPAPEIWWARPALFEPGGRIWFISGDGGHLLGYAGVRGQWIEREAGLGRAFAGSCPGHGRLGRTGHNLAAGGRLFFPDTDGVHVFDGRAWSYEQLGREARDSGFGGDRPDLRQPPVLHALPGGNDVLALTEGADDPVRMYRDGTWAPHRVPQRGGLRFATVAAGPHRLYIRSSAGTWSYPLPRATEVPGRVAERIGRLGDADRAVRERATAELIEMGEPVRGALEQAILRSDDEEVLAQSRLVLAELDRAAAAEGAGGGSSTADGGPPDLQIAGYALRLVWGMHAEADGTLFFSAQSIRRRGAEVGPGVLVAPAGEGAGLARVIRGEGVAHAFFANYPDGLGYRPGESIWAAGSLGHPPAQRLDLRDGVVRTLPDLNFGYLHAVKEDGTVYAGGMSPAWHRPHGVPIMVYRPGLPDERKVVEAATVETGSLDFCVASDGAVWCAGSSGQVLRFDGAWRAVRTLPPGQSAVSFVAGEAGAVLVALRDAGGAASYALYDGRRFHDAPALRALVEAQAPAIARAFPPGARARAGRAPPLAVDRDGNVWVMEAQAVAVYAGGKWLDVGFARGERRSLSPRFITTVGGGAWAYFGDVFGAPDPNTALVGRVEGGAVRTSPAIKIEYNYGGQFVQVLHDREGGVWGHVTHRGPADAKGNSSFEYRPVRITASRAEEPPVGPGRPAFADEAGQIWIKPESAAGAAAPIKIWGAGQVTELAVPGAGPFPVVFAADRPGSVYTWTPEGIVHYVARDPAEPGRFARAATFFPRAAEGNLRAVLGQFENRFEYSSLGYLVSVHEARLYNQAPYYLNLIPLPGGPADGRPLPAPPPAAPPVAATGPATAPATAPVGGLRTAAQHWADRRTLPARLDVAIGDARWQVLPPAVHEVVVGPDDRPWLLCGSEPWSGVSLDPPTARALVEREFARPAPQLWDIVPALFEPAPSRRVWFLHRGILLGYDGTPGLWYERDGQGAQYQPLVSDRRMSRTPGAPQNLAAGGLLFFPHSLGIDVFDGRRWKREAPPPTFGMDEIAGRRRTYRKTFGWEAIFRAPGGKAVIAVCAYPRREAWRYADGRWTTQALPDIGRGASSLGVVATSPDELVFLVPRLRTGARGDDPPAMVPLPLGGELAPKVFEDLHRRLSADEFKVRQEARRALVALGPAAVGRVRAAMEAEEHPEVKQALQQVLRELAEPLPKPVAFGPYTVVDATALHTTPDGTALVSVVRGTHGEKELGQGLLVATPDGKVRFMAGKEYTFGTTGRFPTDHLGPPIVGEGGRFVALPGTGDLMRRGEALPARVIDVPAGSSTPVTAASYTCPHGLLRDGSLFVQSRERGYPHGGPVALFRPAGHDHRTVLKATSLDVASGSVVVADDGAVWAMTGPAGAGVVVMGAARQVVRRGGGAGALARFDGKQWEQRHATRLAGNPRFVATGNGGAVLAIAQDFGSYVLVTPDGAVEDKSALDLVQRHREAFVRAFGGPQPVRHDPYRFAFAVDKDGHVWMVPDEPFGRRLMVLVGGKWVDCADALSRANGGKPLDAGGFGFVDSLCTVGDGSAVWAFSTHGMPREAASFEGRIVDGKPTFRPAPLAGGRPQVVGRDRAGKLLLHAPDGSLKRWDDRGPTEVISAPRAEPGTFHVDPAGTLWQVSYPRDGRAALSVWGGGKALAAVELATDGTASPVPVFGRDGDVFVRTAAGIEHYVAQVGGGADRPAAGLTRRAIYALQTDAGAAQDVLSMDASTLGWLVVMTGKVTDQGWRRSLLLAPLPPLSPLSPLPGALSPPGGGAAPAGRRQP